ncbi:hypothetical protein [Caulobacter sp. UC70_42]|uniref:hypothetical protein n=1 Tax=Caulobacter sp. UC70_42 TaxID=3374551 RepID=UPI0037578B89
MWHSEHCVELTDGCRKLGTFQLLVAWQLAQSWPKESQMRIADGMAACAIERGFGRQGVRIGWRNSRPSPHRRIEQRLMVHLHDGARAFVLDVASRALLGLGMELGRLFVSEIGARVAGDAGLALHALERRVATGALRAEGLVGRRQGAWRDKLSHRSGAGRRACLHHRRDAQQRQAGGDKDPVEEAVPHHSQRSPK